ncbi:MAG: VCBS repeat-containing protein [Deltaproteobacteria bacterium]|nr:VCBS repeat-containing protein [Deltaproteobacteria bacterium]
MAGDETGEVWFFQNTGDQQKPRLLEGVLLKGGGKVIQGIAARYEKSKTNTIYYLVPNKSELMGKYSKIHVADWDQDGLLDLLIGQDGPGNQKMVWYKNQGTKEKPELSAPQEIELASPKVVRPSPYVIDWDQDGRQDLLCGTEGSEIIFYRNKGTRERPVLAEGIPLQLEGNGYAEGVRARLQVLDWNNDGKLDLLIGNVYFQDNKSGGNLWLFLGQ